MTPNDAAFLNEVDVTIITDSGRSAELRALVPNGHAAARRGPAGWSDELLAVLDEPG